MKLTGTCTWRGRVYPKKVIYQKYLAGKISREELEECLGKETVERLLESKKETKKIVKEKGVKKEEISWGKLYDLYKKFQKKEFVEKAIKSGKATREEIEAFKRDFEKSMKTLKEEFKKVGIKV